MKGLIRWAIDNSPAMNTLMVASLVAGAVMLGTLRREVFPEFELEIILVSVPYPGSSPEEVEEGICQKIEEACHSIAGVKKQTSVASEGGGFLILELEASVPDVQKILNEVRSEIDQISSFPDLAEDPDVQQITFRTPAIHVGVISKESDDPDAEYKLRQVAEQVRDELLTQRPPPSDNLFVNGYRYLTRFGSKPGITSANISAAKPYQIDVEIPEDTLRRHGLTLQEIAQIIRRENLEIPGGNIKTSSQELRIRGKNKRVHGSEIEEIQVLTRGNGDVVTIDDLGSVSDGFDDVVQVAEINGQPGLRISIDRTSSEDLLLVASTARRYVENKVMPNGYELKYWGDTLFDVEDRMNMLTRYGVHGLILVFFVLAIFLDLRLAFWVALGIPISILGAGYILPLFGQTLNMLSMFAFLMALGIVVDDAIVIGENIYEHRGMNKGFARAAIDGTYEVLPSVIASVTTTIVAFAPLLFVTGVMGKFIAVMPIAVIAMLVISLLESAFILPCHLAHENKGFFRVLGIVLYPLRPFRATFMLLNRRASALMEYVISRLYIPFLSWALRHKTTVLCGAFSILCVTAGVVFSGLIQLNFMPKLDGRTIKASVAYPDGTPYEFVDRATRLMEQELRNLDEEEFEKTGQHFLDVTYRNVGQLAGSQKLGPNGVTSGGHVGMVEVALVAPTDRSIASYDVLRIWRQRVELWQERWAKGESKNDLEYPDAAMLLHTSESAEMRTARIAARIAVSLSCYRRDSGTPNCIGSLSSSE